MRVNYYIFGIVKLYKLSLTIKYCQMHSPQFIYQPRENKYFSFTYSLNHAPVKHPLPYKMAYNHKSLLCDSETISVWQLIIPHSFRSNKLIRSYCSIFEDQRLASNGWHNRIVLVVSTDRVKTRRLFWVIQPGQCEFLRLFDIEPNRHCNCFIKSKLEFKVKVTFALQNYLPVMSMNV